MSDHSIRISVQGKPGEGFPFPVIFKVDNHQWTIFISDAYGDFSSDRPIMATYLVFRALADYRNSADYPDWCNYFGLEANDPARLDYYRSLNKIVEELSVILGNIEPCISDLDYDLRSGEYHALLEAEKD